MDKTRNQNEQRKHKRFSDAYGAAAAVLTLGSWSKLGLITDISRGGLVFRYLDFKIAPKEEPAGWAELKIIWESRDLSIKSMPCRVIEDYDASPEYSFSLVSMRKCRVAFGDLAPDQKAQLDLIIDHFAASKSERFKG